MTQLISVDETIQINIDDITIHVSPLTYKEKISLQSCLNRAVLGDLDQAMEGAAMCIKYAVKNIDGVKDRKGYKFKLEFEDNGRYLKDSCVDNLLNLPQNGKIVTICSALINGVPGDLGIVDPLTGKTLEGISIEDIPGKGETVPKESGS
jgi:hypothetical protein